VSDGFFRALNASAPLCAHLMRAERVHATMMHLVPLAAAALSCALYIDKGHYDTTVRVRPLEIEK
jgi:hypothetical protein